MTVRNMSMSDEIELFNYFNNNKLTFWHVFIANVSSLLEKIEWRAHNWR